MNEPTHNSSAGRYILIMTSRVCVIHAKFSAAATHLLKNTPFMHTLIRSTPSTKLNKKIYAQTNLAEKRQRLVKITHLAFLFEFCRQNIENLAFVKFE